MLEPRMVIDGREIGPGRPPYVVCELSANHNGDIGRAIRMLEVAASTGTDAIKIQTYTPDTLTIKSQAPQFMIKDGPWRGRTLYELYQQAYTPYEWHPALFARARELGVTLFSTPFDETAVQLLADLNVPAYKIASFEIVDLPLIARVAREGRPMVVSTGMADLGEITSAVATARENGATNWPCCIARALIRLRSRRRTCAPCRISPRLSAQWAVYRITRLAALPRSPRSPLARRLSKSTSLWRAQMADQTPPSPSSQRSSSNSCGIARTLGPRSAKWTIPVTRPSAAM